MRVLLALVSLLVLAPDLVMAAPFRLATNAAAAVPCRPLGSDANASKRALFKLLALRLNVEVLDCPVAGFRGAAEALAAGQVDMGALDPESYAPVAAKVRAILTLRPKDGLIRTQVVTAVRGGSSFKSLGDLRGQRLVFIGVAPYDRDLPRKALADQGAGPSYFSKEVVAASAEDALSRLREQDVDVAVINADAWQRSCRGVKPQDQPCGDLRIVWKGRPRAASAVAVRLDMPPRLRFQIMGIYVAMHLEAPDAFIAASAFAPGNENFDGAEAAALSLSHVIK